MEDPLTAAQPNLHPALNWRKSSASAGHGECLEIAKSDSSVLARDSRDRSGAVLEFTPSQWIGFIERIKEG
jgi:hypothetical protein